MEGNIWPAADLSTGVLIIVGRWIITSVSLLFFLVCAFGNAVAIYKNVTARKRHSTVPLLGGTAGAIGIAIVPVDAVQPFWWIALVMDPGCLLWILLCSTCVLLQARNRR